MKLRHIVIVLAVFAIVGVALTLGEWRAAGTTVLAQSQQPSQPAATPPAPPQQAPAAKHQTPGAQDQTPVPEGPVIRSETRLVRVDAIVTDKKGNYVTDLTENDFKVFEDNKQQQVNSFYFGADGSAPRGAQRHYMILFFDNSTMDFGDQARARDAAAKFIDSNAGPDRVMAIVNFTGEVQITQNFTADVARLKTAVTGLRGSSVNPNAGAPDNSAAAPVPSVSSSGLGGGGSSGLEADFGARSVLIALRNMAKNLEPIPGRKSLIMFTSGFPITQEVLSELTATIDACNKANVAIYPLDVRGLAAPNGSNRWQNLGSRTPEYLAVNWQTSSGVASRPHLVLASYSGSPIWNAPQHGGGGGGTGGGGAGGGHGGSGGGGTGGGGGSGGSGGGGKGGSGGSSGGSGKGGSGNSGAGGNGGSTALPGVPTVAQPRSILPPMPDSPANNQQILATLAEGTGGFTIFNTNDLLSGLDKISREQNAYYLLGYAPVESRDGTCHTLKVKVGRGGTSVRSRSGYCNVKSPDVLTGRPIEKTLEAHATGTSAGSIGGTLEAAYFYTAPKAARIDLAMDIAASSFEFSKDKSRYHSDVNILGIAYKPDGSVAARFSDSVALDFDKDGVKQFTEAPWHYQNQFAIAPGQYRLTVTLSAGNQAFGKYETPLSIEPFDGNKLTMSAMILSDTLHRLADAGLDLDAVLLQDRTPLVVQGYEFVPSGNNRFKKTGKAFVYTQLYEPHLADAKPPQVRIGYRIMDVKSGKQVYTSGALDTADLIAKGSPVIAVGLKVPLDSLSQGSYRLDMQAAEVGGTITPVRAVNFEIE